MIDESSYEKVTALRLNLHAIFQLLMLHASWDGTKPSASIACRLGGQGDLLHLVLLKTFQIKMSCRWQNNILNPKCFSIIGLGKTMKSPC
jgi:hypothetical protein